MERAPRDALYAHPVHPYTKSLLASVPRSDPTRRTVRQRLPGEMPSPVHPPAGCPFHPRCSQAIEICSDVVPASTSLDDGHTVQCLLYEDVPNRTNLEHQT